RPLDQRLLYSHIFLSSDNSPESRPEKTMSTPTIKPPPSVYGRRIIDQSRRLDVHINTIYRMIRDGLKATRVGGAWFVRDEDLDSYFAAKTAARLGSAAPPAHTLDAPSKSHSAADQELAS